MFADFLEDNEHPEAALRRAIGGSVQRRLATPWTEPRWHEHWGSLIPQAHGPEDPYTLPLWTDNAHGDYVSEGSFHPTFSLTRPDSPYWLGRFDLRRSPPPSQVSQDDNYATWRRNRQADSAVRGDWQHLTPAERAYAGIDNLENIDPDLWSHVERIMADQHERGMRLSRYEFAFSPFVTYDSVSNGGPPMNYSHDAFRAVIAENPRDELAHGAYADWLDEQGTEEDALHAKYRRHAAKWLGKIRAAQEAEGPDWLPLNHAIEDKRGRALAMPTVHSYRSIGVQPPIPLHEDSPWPGFDVAHIDREGDWTDSVHFTDPVDALLWSRGRPTYGHPIKALEEIDPKD